MSNPPYKTKTGKPLDLLKDINWEKVTNAFSSLKSVMDSLGYQAPENITDNYHAIMQRLGIFAKELRLFDRTSTYRKALEEIVEYYGSVGNEHERAYVLAKAALESGPEE